MMISWIAVYTADTYQDARRASRTMRTYTHMMQIWHHMVEKHTVTALA